MNWLLIFNESLDKYFRVIDRMIIGITTDTERFSNKEGDKMDNVCGKKRKRFRWRFGQGRNRAKQHFDGTLATGNINQEYLIKEINTDNEDIKDFLFTLGCYEGETITIISILSGQYIVVLKDARYTINEELASCIII